MLLRPTLRLSRRIAQTRGFAVFPTLAIRFRSRNVLQRPFAAGYVRTYATPPPHLNVSDLPLQTYHAYSDATMECLLDSLERLLDELDSPDNEVEYSSGVLTLKLGENGTYVINKQPPNKQIWLSSPMSGPKRYDYVEDQDDWIYSRDKRSIGDLLNAELSQSLQRDIDLQVRNVSQGLNSS